jgi:hypothetical protein
VGSQVTNRSEIAVGDQTMIVVEGTSHGEADV